MIVCGKMPITGVVKRNMHMEDSVLLKITDKFCKVMPLQAIVMAYLSRSVAAQSRKLVMPQLVID